jgi:hypothetical protein
VTPNPYGTEVDGGKVLPLYRMWEQCDRVTLCRETHEQAVNGTCPTHGGDACLHAYVQVRDLIAAQRVWFKAATHR